MGLNWDESKYQNFLHYLLKAIREEEEVQLLLQRIYSTTNEESNVELLDDEKEREVLLQKEIAEMQTKSAAIEEQNRELHAQNEDLRHQLLQYENLKIEHEKAVTQQLKEKIEQISNLTEENLILKKQLEALKAKYDDLENSVIQEFQIYEYYQSLSPALKASLSGIFRGDTLQRFLFCGSQKQNMELLWDAIKIRLMNGNVEELEKLQAIFLYFFHAYNSTFEKPLYELQEVEVHEKFDSEKHIRTSDSLVSGKITKVLFKGYLNTNSRKIERKSIVTL